MFFNSSWALFSPIAGRDRDDGEEEVKEEAKALKGISKDYEPFLFYGKTFSFDNSEKKLINALRTWNTANFAKNSVFASRDQH